MQPLKNGGHYSFADKGQIVIRLNVEDLKKKLGIFHTSVACVIVKEIALFVNKYLRNTTHKKPELIKVMAFFLILQDSDCWSQHTIKLIDSTGKKTGESVAAATFFEPNFSKQWNKIQEVMPFIEKYYAKFRNNNIKKQTTQMEGFYDCMVRCDR